MIKGRTSKTKVTVTPHDLVLLEFLLRVLIY